MAAGLLLSLALMASASAADYSYENCNITRWTTSDASKLVNEVTLDCGRNAGVYEGSTGLIYLGEQTQKFIEVGGKRVRFRIHKVKDNESVATIYQAPLLESEVKESRRVILRARKEGDTPVKDYTYLECRIIDYSMDGDEKFVQRVEIFCRADAGVYIGSTGLFFLGKEKQRFVEVNGERVRFLVDKIDGERVFARIIQTRPSLPLLQANQRVLLRVKKG